MPSAIAPRWRRPATLGAVALMITVLVIASVLYSRLNRSPEPSVNSIAVLPFGNTSGNPDAEYLIGLTR